MTDAAPPPPVGGRQRVRLDTMTRFVGALLLPRLRILVVVDVVLAGAAIPSSFAPARDR